LLAAFALPLSGADYHVFPFDVDPPVEIDGDLGDWESIPNVLLLQRREQVTYTPEVWEGPKDLSAVIRIAWRHGGLFVAAEVTDDVVNQPYRARDIWKGDHVNLWVDLIPGQEADRRMFGKGQFHVAVSPGSLGGIDGREEPTPPEIHVFRPEGLKQEGGQIVARRAAEGYVIEAFLPWTRLGVTPVKMNQDANFEVGVSEADGAPARQEMMMTFGTDKWVYSRQRMLQVVFGDGNGAAPPPSRGTEIADALELAPGQARELTFSVETIPEDKETSVFFKARLSAKSVLGVRDRAMAAELNGMRLAGDRVINRPPESRHFMGELQRFVWPDGALGLFIADGYDRPHRSKRYSLMDYAPNCEYEFLADGLLRTGTNTLRLVNLLPAPGAGANHTIALGEISLKIKPRVPPAPAPGPAPTGVLPTIEPQQEFPATYSALRQRGAALTFTLNGQTVSVESRFTTPDGRWRTESNPFYSHRREVRTHDEWLEVRDTFVNLRDARVPIVQEHVCRMGDRLTAVWLGGYRLQGLSGRKADAANPSVFGATQTAGAAMFPLNDEFLVHVEMSSRDNGDLVLADRSFVLEKGKTYTAEWAIVPVPSPDFWDFINQARRARDVNFTLKWTFAFMSQPWPIYMWSDEQFKQFIDCKSADFVVVSNNLTRVRGRYPRCTDMYNADLKAYRDFFAKFRRLYPDGTVKCGHYYHCFLDTTPANADRFKDDRALDRQGQHMNYGGKGSYMTLYTPTTKPGGWGEEIAKWVDLILDDFGADGVFWDEFTRSRGAFVYNMWDGCTADIDPQTFRIRELKGSVTLISAPFREKLVKRILADGRPFVINGAPWTRSLCRHKFMAFSETGSITHCRRMLLYSPVALGDHLTERVEEDCYRVMLEALDQGCLYSWYSTRIFPTHKTLTEYMFPFTPVELHSGHVIGRERILTKRSGLFGWGDDARFSVHVFDRTGRETQEIKTPRVSRNGRAYAEIRIPEGYSAAIVRE